MADHYLDTYLEALKKDSPPPLIESIEKITGDIRSRFIGSFECRERKTGLLLGHVQSGKTSHVFGLISDAADAGFRIFILLTTDSVYLHQQTLARAHKMLTEFNICSENDHLRLLAGTVRPLLIVLKKNTRILNAWVRNLETSRLTVGKPLFIVDDEGDATSLNTLVNRNGQSAVNRALENLKNLGNSSIYFQVTATPQAVLLQTRISGWQPEFIACFRPGSGYLGGRFFYSTPPSFTIITIPEDDFSARRRIPLRIPEGLKRAIMTYLLTASQFKLDDENTCNCLIHPSYRIRDHEDVVQIISDFLEQLSERRTDGTIIHELREIWLDLQSSKPDMARFERIVEMLPEIIESVTVIPVNSRSDFNDSYEKGFNIVVGGNSLGRGITFPKLQTVYYSRRARTPQADTYWQHSRMFGYDREPSLMRIFIPLDLLQVFTALSESNDALFSLVEECGVQDIALVYSRRIRPTRRNVVDQDFLNMIPGGVNFFPRFPLHSNESRPHTDILNKLLSAYSGHPQSVESVGLDFLIELLEHCKCEEEEFFWDSALFQNCLSALKAESSFSEGSLLVRRDRRISQGTGTVLSPDDRRIGSSIVNKPVLTMYRLTGEEELRWKGHPFWLPNIKFPTGRIFYSTDD